MPLATASTFYYFPGHVASIEPQTEIGDSQEVESNIHTTNRLTDANTRQELDDALRLLILEVPVGRLAVNSPENYVAAKKMRSFLLNPSIENCFY